MPYIKEPLSLLAECAMTDMRTDTESLYTESQIKTAYNSVDEIVNEDFKWGADTVPVMTFKDGTMLTEMNYLAPYMRDNEITSVEEALNDVATANRLQPKQVGLLVESQECVDSMIDQAIAKGGKQKTKTFDKLFKGQSLIDKLKKKGYPVKKKKSSTGFIAKRGKKGIRETDDTSAMDGADGENSGTETENTKVCPKCGKAKCECGKQK